MRGLHVHIGSQILDVEPFAASVAPVAALGQFPVYDLGGGLGARYRIPFAMGRDGMIPSFFRRLNARTLTPVPATLFVAVVVSALAGVLPIDFLAEMTSIGTLAAFLIVSVGVMVLRQRAPDLPRGFKVPLYPLTPLLSIAGCIWIIQDLRVKTIYVFFGWAAVALLWYFFYARRHSALERSGATGEATP